MHLQLVCLEIHLGVKYNELLFQALSIWTQEVVFPEVLFERIVVDIVLLFFTSTVPAIANMATFVFVPAMRVKLVISVETHSAEAAFRVSLESALIDRAGIIIAKFLVLP
jgi:hypothetical protein